MKLTKEVLKKMIKEAIEEASMNDPQAGPYSVRRARSQQIMRDKAKAGVFDGGYGDQQINAMERAVKTAEMALRMGSSLGVRQSQYDLLVQAAEQGHEQIKNAIANAIIKLIGMFKLIISLLLFKNNIPLITLKALSKLSALKKIKDKFT